MDEVGRLIVNAQDKHGYTMLHSTFHAHEARQLIDHKADVNITNDYGDTPLHSATHYIQKSDIVRVLVEAQCDLTIRNRKGMTAAMVARKTSTHTFSPRDQKMTSYLSYQAIRDQARARAETERKHQAAAEVQAELKRQADAKAEQERQAAAEAERRCQAATEANEQRHRVEREARQRAERKLGSELKAHQETQTLLTLAQDAKRIAEQRLEMPYTVVSNLCALRYWHRLLNDNALARVTNRSQSALANLRQIETDAEALIGSPSDAAGITDAARALANSTRALADAKSSLGSPSDVAGSPNAAPTLDKSTRALADAEAKVRSVLKDLDNKGATVETASNDDMEKLDVVVTARDKICAEELKSMEQALKSVRSALEKPDALLKAASSALTNARDAVTSIQQSFEQIGGDWKSVESQSINAGPNASPAPDWKSIDSAWRSVKNAFETERKASVRVLDDTLEESVAGAQMRVFSHWNESRAALSAALSAATKTCDTQEPIAIAHGRECLASIAALAKETTAVHLRIKGCIESGTQRLNATKKGLERLVFRARALNASKVNAEKFEEKYNDMEEKKEELQSNLKKAKRAVRRCRDRRKIETLRKSVTEVEEALREFAKNPNNKLVINVLLSLMKIRPELAFFNSTVDPFAGTSGGGRRVRSFEEYENVTPLSKSGPQGDANRLNDTPKLYSATVATNDDALPEEMQRSNYLFPIASDTKRATAPGAAVIPCVIKAFEGERGIKDMRRAVHVMGIMSHPNVIQLQGICRDDGEGRWLIQLPRYPCDLWQWVLAERKALMSCPGVKFPAEVWQGRCARMLGAVLRGLDYLHFRGVVHRDLKPQNVLVGPPLSGNAQNVVKIPGRNDEYPVICDFETCTVEELKSGATTTRNVVSEGFVDPRLLLRKVSASPETDMYSFGIVMGEVLLGRRLDTNNPMQDITLSDDAKQHLSVEQRDIVVSLLRDPTISGNPRRPTAAEVLQLHFFSTGAAAMLEQ